MKLYYVTSGPLRVNTYFLVNEEKKEAIVIDCGENYKLVKETEGKLGVKIKYLLLTHAHFDHSFSAKMFQDEGVKVYVGEKEVPLIFNDDNLASRFRRNFMSFTPDKVLKDGETLNLLGINILVIHTPGHTVGSVTYIVENNMFTGDTLFLECIGRTDFPTGDKQTLIASVKKLYNFSGDYNVYPGHDEFTTLEHERKNNLFVDYD